MSAPEITDEDRDGLLARAKLGDGDAFRALIAPHLRALHLHCYRMLGSYEDAEEATQEALERAWRSLGTYEGRAPLLHWLYRITTTTCLKMIDKRSRPPVTTGEIAHLQPYPDRLLDQLADASVDPAAVVEQRETVGLAFITALQRLPATQRAVLILREVLAWKGAEVAELLDTTVPAVNSSLQRARATLKTTVGPDLQQPLSRREREVLDRFVHAWHRGDIAALAELLREDAVLRMPPEPIIIAGRERIAEFFATVPAGGQLHLIRLQPIRANGQPALAAYLPDSSGECRGYGIMVLSIADGEVATITGFPDASLFAYFGLPPRCDSDHELVAAERA